jgi:hypothetical protein
MSVGGAIFFDKKELLLLGEHKWGYLTGLKTFLHSIQRSTNRRLIRNLK